jgi:hypothetical protein
MHFYARHLLPVERVAAVLFWWLSAFLSFSFSDLGRRFILSYFNRPYIVLLMFRIFRFHLAFQDIKQQFSFAILCYRTFVSLSHFLQLGNGCLYFSLFVCVCVYSSFCRLAT